MRGIAIAALAAGVLAGGAAAPGPAAAAPGDPYVVLGDSVSYGMSSTSTNESFVGRLYADFQTTRGAGALVNRAQPGATSAGGRNSQLPGALADINAPSDTVAATIGFGGNEALNGSCVGKWDDPSCPLRENLNHIVSEIKKALAADPGEEFFALLSYYNPGVGTSQEDFYRGVILGSNSAVGCDDSGDAVGLNDVIFQVAGEHGVAVADTYGPMLQAGQAAIAGDGIHPNDTGHAVIAQAFMDAATLCLPEGGPGPVDPPAPTCNGIPATIVAGTDVAVGTNGRDVIVGTARPDYIRGRGGNDLICARAGNDKVEAGDGRDAIVGGKGADELRGQAGRDLILGLSGADRLFGGPGPDRLFGGAGRDRLFGGPGLDRLAGGAGVDRLVQ